jgi:TonB-dependent outer membrane receptor, SusC/RagA subfamily, signature region
MKYFKSNSIYDRRFAISLSALLFMLLLVQTASANVIGTVRDTKGHLLAGVIVTIQESTVTTKTSETGEFSIPAVSGDNLTFALEGYRTITKHVDTVDSKIELMMQELRVGSREQDLVQIAYSSKNKRDLTSAVSMTTFEELSKRKDMNTMNGIGGLINGLGVISSGWADTGVGTSYYVRGVKTTNQNNPLILVDDIERTFDQLNVNEIESISVLKDAAALAIYGNRGANGVCVG